MGEYLGAVVAMSAVLGVISYVSYPSGCERSVKFALTVLLLFCAMTPILGFASEIIGADVGGILSGIEGGNVNDSGESEKTAEEAFKEGICKLLFTKFKIDEGDVEVYVFNFDFKAMRAGKIKILLSGRGAGADFRGIEEYITECGLGECEVIVLFE